MTSEEKSIKVIEFTGTDFKIWSKKFVARANRKGYKGLLEGTEPILTKSKYGHKSQEYPKHQTGRDQKKFRGKCWYCGEEGRTAFHCEKRKSGEKREKTEEKVIFAFGKQTSNIEDYIMSEDSEGIEIGL